MSRFTPWFPMATKPVRGGEYEGREKRSGLRIPVHWRKLDGEARAGWYFYRGVLCSFRLWESAEGQMSGWRGLTKSASLQSDTAQGVKP